MIISPAHVYQQDNRFLQGQTRGYKVPLRKQNLKGKYTFSGTIEHVRKSLRGEGERGREQGGGGYNIIFYRFHKIL